MKAFVLLAAAVLNPISRQLMLGIPESRIKVLTVIVEPPVPYSQQRHQWMDLRII